MPLSNVSPVLKERVVTGPVKLHQAVIKLQIMNNYGPIFKPHSHDVHSRRLRQAQNGGTPSSERVDQFIRPNVPELKLSLLATKEDLIQIGVRMDNAHDLNRLRIKVNFSIEFYSGVCVCERESVTKIERVREKRGE